MEKENFRVLLDISDVQDRVHNFVWMLISTVDLKSIADLKNAIIKKLDLDRSDVKLFVNGGLLLEEEKIIILRENDTVQIRYEKIPDSFCHNSSLMEVQDSRLSLTAEKFKENKISKHSKKHKRRSEGTNSVVAEGNKKLIQHETPPDSSIHNLSYVEVEDNKLSINAEKCNGNEISKHSKRHKRRNEGDDLCASEENININLSQNKRKRDVASIDTFDKIENEMQVESPPLNNGTVEEKISSSQKKKINKSGSTSTAKEVIPNESDNKVEIIDIPVVSDASISLKKPEDRINVEENMNNITTDISVVQGSNCKKRKRKRNRKRKIDDANLLGPFMTANISTFQNFTKDDSRALSPCDDYAGIRKHIKFTSPNRKSNATEIKAVDPETKSSNYQSENPPIKTFPSPSSKCPSLHENVARATEIANKVALKFCTSPNSIRISPSTKTSSLAINKTENTKEFFSKTSSKTCTVPSSTNFLFSTKPALNSDISSTENLAEPKLVEQNPWTVSPMQKENGIEPYQLSASFYGEPVKYSVPSYTDFPIMKVLPPMGTHIAFKLLELGENYSPEVSDYKEGIIKSMKPGSEELEIDLIDIEIKPGRTGKFENLKEDEDPQEEVIKKVMVSWSSLIEPRIISQDKTNE